MVSGFHLRRPLFTPPEFTIVWRPKETVTTNKLEGLLRSDLVQKNKQRNKPQEFPELIVNTKLGCVLFLAPLTWSQRWRRRKPPV